MANSKKPEAASLAAAGHGSAIAARAAATIGPCPGLRPARRLRRPRARGAAATPTAPAGWQAAIGFLDVTGSPEVCTAVLVRPDMIATTSHCLRPKGRFAQPNQLVFTPSAAGPQVRGAALVAEGGSVAPGNIKPDQAQTDWALVRITPPLSGIRPLPLAPLSPAMVRAKIAGGARFYSAGYGQGAKDELRTHKGCGLLPPDPNGVTEGAMFFATDCIIRLGDSGGPVILIEGGQPRLIGLIVGFANAAQDRRSDRHRGLGQGVCALSRRGPRQPAVPGRICRPEISMN